MQNEIKPKAPPSLKDLKSKKKTKNFIVIGGAIVALVAIVVAIILIVRNSSQPQPADELITKDALSVRENSPSNASYTVNTTVDTVLNDLFPVVNSQGGLEGKIELIRNQDVILKGSFALFDNNTSAFKISSAKAPTTTQTTVLEPQVDSIFLKEYDYSNKKNKPWFWLYPGVNQLIPGDQTTTRQTFYSNLVFEPAIVNYLLTNNNSKMEENRIIEADFDINKIIPIYYAKLTPEDKLKQFSAKTFKGKAMITRFSNRVEIDIPVNYISDEELNFPSKFSAKNLLEHPSATVRFTITGRPNYQISQNTDEIRIAKLDQTANILSHALDARNKGNNQVDDLVNKFLLTPDWQKCDRTRLGQATSLIFSEDFQFPTDIETKKGYYCRSEINTRQQRNATIVSNGELLGLLTQKSNGKFYYAKVSCQASGNCAISSREEVKEKPARKRF